MPIDTAAMKMIGMDLDGTALDYRGQVDRLLRGEIESLREQGTIIVAATARPLRGLREIIDIESIIDYAILCNGSHLVQFHPFKDIQKFELEIPLLLQLLKSLIELLPEPKIACDFDAVRLPLCTEDVEEISHWFQERFWKSKMDEYGAILRLDISQDHMEPSDLLPLLDKTFGHLCSVSQSGQQKIEIGPHGATKGSALASLAGMYDIDKADMAAIGDMLNDISMFNVVGLSAAVANAHEQARHQANIVTKKHQQHGVLEFLRFINQNKH